MACGREKWPTLGAVRTEEQAFHREPDIMTVPEEGTSSAILGNLGTRHSEEVEEREIEKELDDILREGDLDAIHQKVTPKTLAKCKTNTLLKAFQVSKKLRDLAHEGNPEKDDIEKLEKSLNEFTSALIDPLKANASYKKEFSSCFDHVMDKAIDTKQKKFIAHPAVYNLLNSTWYGSFSKVRTESWWKPRRWGYLFLNLWTVLDFLLFPLLFAIFFVIHLFKRASRNRIGIAEKDIYGIAEKDIYEKYKDYLTTPYFIFFHDTLSYLTLIGLHFAICLSPSTVSFSGIEWVIFVFFVGRILMEVDQFINAKKAGVVKARTTRRGSYDGLSHNEENETAEDNNILFKKFISYFRYFRF